MRIIVQIRTGEFQRMNEAPVNFVPLPLEKNTRGSENTEKSEKSEKFEKSDKSDKSEKSETSQNTQNTKKAQNTPEPPKKAKTQIRHLSNTVNGFDYSFSWMQGRRPTMEDEHIIEHLEIDSEEPSSLFAVLDGHGGSTAATGTCENGFSPETVRSRKQSLKIEKNRKKKSKICYQRACVGSEV